MQSRFYSHLNSAVRLCSTYDGLVPIAVYLKKYFSGNKKFGSKDRKQISHLFYCFFRLGKLILNSSTEEKVLVGLFLCSTESNELLAALKPNWNEKVGLSFDQKISFLNLSISFNDIFPWKEELSEDIDFEKYAESFLVQPDLFIRIRPGCNEKIIAKLDELKVKYELIPPFTVRLPNSFKIDQHFDLDKDVVIQDYNSQQTSRLIGDGISKLNSEITFWDCCAASGGKSIMSFDVNSKINITVSDVRKSILENLKQRFRVAEIVDYHSFVSDLTKPPKSTDKKYNFILADVPCTGSGTWSRTPEQLYYFEKDKIEYFASLQRKIVSNAAAQLATEGYFLYSTCSIFKEENEQIAKFIQEKFNLQLVKTEFLKGYEIKADTLFTALFTSSKV